MYCKYERWVFAAACTAIAPAASAHAAFIIDDRSFFEGIDHTLIDFETEADGTPIALEFNGIVLLTGTEYSSLGVRFATDSPIAIVKSGSPSDRDALRIGGSLDNAFAFGTLTRNTPFEILFDTPVHAAGFFALTVVTLTAPEFEAFGVSGQSLGTFGLFGDLIDGQVDFVRYGYIGIASDEAIARIALSNGEIGWGIDDLRFSAVPAPGGVIVLVGGVGLLGVRRRRG